MREEHCDEWSDDVSGRGTRVPARTLLAVAPCSNRRYQGNLRGGVGRRPARTARTSQLHSSRGNRLLWTPLRVRRGRPGREHLPDQALRARSSDVYRLLPLNPLGFSFPAPLTGVRLSGKSEGLSICTKKTRAYMAGLLYTSVLRLLFRKRHRYFGAFNLHRFAVTVTNSTKRSKRLRKNGCLVFFEGGLEVRVVSYDA